MKINDQINRGTYRIYAVSGNDICFFRDLSDPRETVNLVNKLNKKSNQAFLSGKEVLEFFEAHNHFHNVLATSLSRIVDWSSQAEENFDELITSFGLEKNGVLPCGEEYNLFLSRKKAPGLFYGLHLVVMVREDLKIVDTPQKVIEELAGLGYRIGQQISSQISPLEDSFKLETNGKGIVTRDWVHFHIICPTIYDWIFYSVMRDPKEFIKTTTMIFKHLIKGTKPLEMAKKVNGKLAKCLERIK